MVSSRLVGVIKVVCAWTLFGAIAAACAAQETAVSPEMQAKQAEEDALVERLMERGVERERFRLPDIVPKGGATARMTVQARSVQMPWGMAYEKQPVRWYPKDVERFNINTLPSGYEFWPTGHGSVWCIWGAYKPSGYLATKGYFFEGDESDPLTFILLDGVGLTYLHGKGRVRLADGTAVRLGCPEQSEPQASGGDTKPQFVIADIQPTLTGHQNNAAIVGNQEKREVWLECPQTPAAKLVLAKGGFFAQSMTDQDGALTYLHAPMRINFDHRGTAIEGGPIEVSQGAKVLVACREGLTDARTVCAPWDSADWFVGNIDYDGSTYMLRGHVRLLGWAFEGRDDAPLVFALAKDKGFTYLSGKGKVTDREGRSTVFGDAVAAKPVVQLTGEAKPEGGTTGDTLSGEVSASLAGYLNDYLVLVLWAINANQPAGRSLERDVPAIMRKHNMAGAKTRGMLRATGFEMSLVGSDIWVKMGPEPIDLLSLIFTERGDFPDITLRAGLIWPLQGWDRYTPVCSAVATVNGREYTMSEGKWVARVSP